MGDRAALAGLRGPLIGRALAARPAAGAAAGGSGTAGLRASARDKTPHRQAAAAGGNGTAGLRIGCVPLATFSTAASGAAAAARRRFLADPSADASPAACVPDGGILQQAGVAPRQGPPHRRGPRPLYSDLRPLAPFPAPGSTPFCGPSLGPLLPCPAARPSVRAPFSAGRGGKYQAQALVHYKIPHALPRPVGRGRSAGWAAHLTRPPPAVQADGGGARPVRGRPPAARPASPLPHVKRLRVGRHAGHRTTLVVQHSLPAAVRASGSHHLRK